MALIFSVYRVRDGSGIPLVPCEGVRGYSEQPDPMRGMARERPKAASVK